MWTNYSWTGEHRRWGRERNRTLSQKTAVKVPVLRIFKSTLVSIPLTWTLLEHDFKKRFEEYNLKSFILGRKMFRNNLCSLAWIPSSADIWSVKRYFLKARNLKILVKILFKGDNSNCEWICREQILSVVRNTIPLTVTGKSKKTKFSSVSGGEILQKSKVASMKKDGKKNPKHLKKELVACQYLINLCKFSLSIFCRPKR